jgi:pyruvate,orthophosphate dikinase
LQTRNGKRTGAAMVKIAMDLLREGLIDEKTAIERCEPNKLDELLHPVFDKKALKKAQGTYTWSSCFTRCCLWSDSILC